MNHEKHVKTEGRLTAYGARGRSRTCVFRALIKLLLWHTQQKMDALPLSYVRGLEAVGATQLGLLSRHQDNFLLVVIMTTSRLRTYRASLIFSLYCFKKSNITCHFNRNGFVTSLSKLELSSVCMLYDWCARWDSDPHRDLKRKHYIRLILWICSTI